MTIHDVAARAQVSASTVSRAFTTPELVRPATRERVLRIAGEVGYRPNRPTRGQPNGRTAKIGLVVPDLVNPFFPAVVKGAQARAAQAAHAVLLADTDENPDREVTLIDVLAEQVDGIVLCSSRMSDAQLNRVTSSTALTFINRKVAGAPSVLIDAADGMRQAVEHLAALGHRRVAYLSGPRSSWSNRQRRRGMRAAARAKQIDVVELGPFAPQFEAGLQAADLVLAAGVTAVLAYNDLIALGVLNRAADRGVAVPDDLSIVGFDDIAFAAMCTPPLTTVLTPKELTGRAAVELLLDWLDRDPLDRTDDPQRTLGTQLIVRSSTAPPARAGAGSNGRVRTGARLSKGD